MSVTKLGISHGYTNGHFTQMFWKSIRKINSACNEAVTELEELRKENDVLKQRNYILENELLSSKSLRKLENVLGKEQSLCKNAIRLMNTPITESSSTNPSH